MCGGIHVEECEGMTMFLLLMLHIDVPDLMTTLSATKLPIAFAPEVPGILTAKHALNSSPFLFRLLFHNTPL
jgi:hypothetical protein